METIKTPYESFTDIPKELIKKQRCGKSITYSIIILVFSIASILAAKMLNINTTSPLYLLLMTLGVVGICVAIIKFIVSNKLVYTPTQSTVKKYSIFFNPEDTIKLEKAIENREIQSIKNYVADNRTTGLKLDVMISADKKFGVCQVYKFIPHNFEPTTKVINIGDEHLPIFYTTITELYAKQ